MWQEYVVREERGWNTTQEISLHLASFHITSFREIFSVLHYIFFGARGKARSWRSKPSQKAREGSSSAAAAFILPPFARSIIHIKKLLQRRQLANQVAAPTPPSQRQPALLPPACPSASVTHATAWLPAPIYRPLPRLHHHDQLWLLALPLALKKI